MVECTFCRIVSGELPAHVVAEDELTVAFLDRSPASNGHTLMQSNRSAGWQDVFHFHLHVIPRSVDVGLVPPWRPRDRTDDELAATLARLR